jgi:hypothetical protein
LADSVTLTVVLLALLSPGPRVLIMMLAVAPPATAMPIRAGGKLASIF